MNSIILLTHFSFLYIFEIIFLGGINKEEMLRTFNCGIGAILICSEKDKGEVLNQLKTENPKVIGYVCNHTGKFSLI